LKITGKRPCDHGLVFVLRRASLLQTGRKIIEIENTKINLVEKYTITVILYLLRNTAFLFLSCCYACVTSMLRNIRFSFYSAIISFEMNTIC
jgi:hypothetical protein